MLSFSWFIRLLHRKKHASFLTGHSYLQASRLGASLELGIDYHANAIHRI